MTRKRIYSRQEGCGIKENCWIRGGGGGLGRGADRLLLCVTGKGLPPSQCDPLACHWRRCRRRLLDSPLQQTGLEQGDVRRGNEGGRKSRKKGDRSGFTLYNTPVGGKVQRITATRVYTDSCISQSKCSWPRPLPFCRGLALDPGILTPPLSLLPVQQTRLGPESPQSARA